MHEPLTLLLVEDDADDCLFFMEAINLIDPTIVGLIAQNGIVAINRLQNESLKPDLIFADMNMPKMNGPEFVVALKTKRLCPGTPIIIYSTTEIEQWHLPLAAAGVTDFLVKECSLGALRRQLEQVLTKHQLLPADHFVS